MALVLVTSAPDAAATSQPLADGLSRAAAAEGTWAPTLRKLYARLDGRPLLLRYGRPGPDAFVLAAALDELESHGLDPQPYPRERLAEALAHLAVVQPPVDSPGPAAVFTDPDASAWESAWQAITQSVGTGAAAGAVDTSARARAITRWQTDPAGAEATWRDAWAAADVLLAVSVLRYAFDFRYLRRTNPYRAADRPAARLAEVETALLGHALAAREDMAGTLAGLRPSHPQYAKLRAFLPTYRALAKRTVPRIEGVRRLRKGDKGPAVAAVRERLRLEGYSPGPAGEVFDDALRAAVLDFQETHGLAPLGEVGKFTVRAMNVAMADRVAQLELALQRWRESPLRSPEGRYVRVNLPSFVLELWDGATLLRRHAVIIGSHKELTDLGSETTGRLNHTKVLSSHIYQVILNPYWRVPARIASLEIGPEVERDETYLETNGFLTRVNKRGEVLYVQAPGPENPLGQVKFLFRNDFSLYLHDTDKRELFTETQRDFSHGCVRVHDPLDLALAIVGHDSGRTSKELRRILETGKEYGVRLERPLPIHIEYVTAEVDAYERIVFLKDVYEFDKAIRAGLLPVEEVRPATPEELEATRKKLAEKAAKGDKKPR